MARDAGQRPEPSLTLCRKIPLLFNYPDPATGRQPSRFVVKNFPMKTIPARVTRNVKEDPSIQEFDVWNVETALLEKLPNEEVSLIADPNEIQVEQIPGSKLDKTRTIFTIRTKGHSPLKVGDTIHVDVRC
jgi:hypothetical protein